MKRLTLVFGWLVVVGLATALTWQIVSAADDRVSERPIAPLNVTAPALINASTTSNPTTPATTVAPAPTSTTAAAAWQTRSVRTAGGTVILRYRPGDVTYQSATPAPGFQVEVERPGPPEVRLEFESEAQKVEVDASWEDDGLDVQISTEHEDEDED